MQTSGTILLAGLLSAAGMAQSQQAATGGSLFHAETLLVPDSDQSFSNLAIPETRKRFGAEGTGHIMFGSTLAYDLSSNTDTNLHGQWTTFIVDDFEIGVEGGVWAIFQGDNTAAISTSVVMRYHFYQGTTISLFAEAGLGLMAAGDTVPDMGTGFNFMPRLGGGFTCRLGPDDSTRLIAGLRWHHISNARIHGEARNPSRDAPGFYAGLMFDF